MKTKLCKQVCQLSLNYVGERMEKAFLAGFTVPIVLILHLSSRVGGIETLRRPVVSQKPKD